MNLASYPLILKNILQTNQLQSKWKNSMKNGFKCFALCSLLSLITLSSLTGCSKNQGDTPVNQTSTQAVLKKLPDGPSEKFDGTNQNTFDSSMEVIAKKLSDEQKATIDHAFELLGDEITDQISLTDDTVQLNLTNEVLKKIHGKTYGEVVLTAENYLQRNIDFKRVEINHQIDDLLQKKEHQALEDKEQCKLAYLNEQQALWRAMKGTIAEFNFEHSDELISADLAERTQGKKHKVTGYEPYETEPDKYRALYQTLYPKK